MKKVTKDQIQKIHKFTEARYVEWYDVQIELVDHLANGIENQWQTNSNISFDDALTNEFKKFGIFGFQDLVEEKTKSINKYYRKQVWFCLKEFFVLPKLIITLFVVWVLFNLMHFLKDKDSLMIIFLLGILAVHVFHIVRFKISIKQRKKKTGKKWLFENSIIQLGGLSHFLNIGIWYPSLFNSDREWTNTSELIVSTCIILYLLILFVSVMIIPEKLKGRISKQYPEYDFS